MKDINATAPGASSSEGTGARTRVGRWLYFVADDGVSGHELWRSDGTTAGTTLVRDIRVGDNSSAPKLSDHASIDGITYFKATRPATGYELWRTNGKRKGTWLVRDINEGAGSSDPSELLAVGKRIFLAANDGTRGTEPWILIP